MNWPGGGLLFVDSDDVLEPDALEVLMAAYEEGGCDYVSGNYSSMSEDGSKVAPSPSPRVHGAPWSRVYSREVWRNLEFPEGFWFEDTVQKYCITPRFTERYVDKPLYRYRTNGKGICATSTKHKKSLDTFWIVGEMLGWCRQLGIVFGQTLFEQTLKQLGPLARDRTGALDNREKEALFVCSCDLLASVPEFQDMETAMGGRWNDLLFALRTRNYRLWKLASSAL